MKKVSIIFCLPFILSAMVLVGCGGVPQEAYDSLQQQYAVAQAENSKLETLLGEQANQATNDIAKLESKLDDALEANKQLDQQLQDLEDKIQLYKDTFGADVHSSIMPPDNVALINNLSAVNPTWEALSTFLATDETDKLTYQEDIFDCSQFAERLHNNAEAQGIRSAFVMVFFDNDIVGHSLNAFLTIDKGLVFIDDTGHSDSEQPIPLGCVKIPPQPWDSGSTIIGGTNNYDKVAFIKQGEPLGLVSLGITEPSLQADYYAYMRWRTALDNYLNRLGRYNQDANQYNLDVWQLTYLRIPSIHPYTGSELSQIRELEQTRTTLEKEGTELKSLSDTFGAFWNELGEVASIDIYW